MKNLAASMWGILLSFGVAVWNETNSFPLNVTALGDKSTLSLSSLVKCMSVWKN